MGVGDGRGRRHGGHLGRVERVGGQRQQRVDNDRIGSEARARSARRREKPRRWRRQKEVRFSTASRKKEIKRNKTRKKTPHSSACAARLRVERVAGPLPAVAEAAEEEEETEAEAAVGATGISVAPMRLRTEMRI